MRKPTAATSWASLSIISRDLSYAQDKTVHTTALVTQLLHTGWNKKQLNESTRWERSDDTPLHQRLLYHWATSPPPFLCLPLYLCWFCRGTACCRQSPAAAAGLRHPPHLSLFTTVPLLILSLNTRHSWRASPAFRYCMLPSIPSFSCCSASPNSCSIGTRYSGVWNTQTKTTCSSGINLSQTLKLGAKILTEVMIFT